MLSHRAAENNRIYVQSALWIPFKIKGLHAISFRQSRLTVQHRTRTIEGHSNLQSLWCPRPDRFRPLPAPDAAFFLKPYARNSELTASQAESALRAFAHRISPRRQRPHFHLQLALRPPQRRHHDPPPRRYRCRAQHRSLRQFHFRGTEMARPRLGRGIQAVRARRALHRQMAEAIFRKRPGLPRLHPRPQQATSESETIRRAGNLAVQSRRCANSPRDESDRRAAAGEPFALRFRVPRDSGRVLRFTDAFTASKPNPPPTSKTSPCCAAMACPPITWPPAPTTPTCASATSFAARTTSPTPSSTC